MTVMSDAFLQHFIQENGYPDMFIETVESHSCCSAPVIFISGHSKEISKV